MFRGQGIDWDRMDLSNRTVRPKEYDYLKYTNELGIYDPAESGDDETVIATLVSPVPGQPFCLVFNYKDVVDDATWDTNFTNQWRVRTVAEDVWCLEFQDRSTTGTRVRGVGGTSWAWAIWGIFITPEKVTGDGTYDILALLRLGSAARAPRGAVPFPPVGGAGPHLPLWVQLGRWVALNPRGQNTEPPGGPMSGNDYLAICQPFRLPLAIIIGRYRERDQKEKKEIYM